MPSSRSRVLLVATATLWVAAYVAWTADWMVDPMPHFLARSMARIPLCLAGIGLCWAMASILDGARGRSWPARLCVAFALCVASSAAYAGMNAIMFSVVLPLWGRVDAASVLQLSLTIAWVFVAWCALYFAVTADAEARDARLRLEGSRAAEFRARHQALAQQISPHFLFNALNVVSGLILEGASTKAERVTMSLAALLRRSLETDGRELVPLGDEVEAAMRYLAIEEARFEGRFTVVDAVPDELKRFGVPAMILQPLVENSVKHGVARSTRLVTLRVSAAVTHAAVEICLLDDAEPDPASLPRPGLGIGESSVRERLELLYGDAATLRSGRRRPSGYGVVLRLPGEVAAGA